MGRQRPEVVLELPFAFLVEEVAFLVEVACQATFLVEVACQATFLGTYQAEVVAFLGLKVVQVVPIELSSAFEAFLLGWMDLGIS